jgi:hypothetical protein
MELITMSVNNRPIYRIKAPEEQKWAVEKEDVAHVLFELDSWKITPQISAYAITSAALFLLIFIVFY